MNLWQTTAVLASGIARDGDASAALALREQVLMQTQAAEDAVLRPADPGSWPHALRAALAARIAGLNQDATLKSLYLQGFETAPEAVLADPSQDGAGLDLSAVVAFMDRVAMRPRDIRADDIEVLKQARISDADIVRLCELNAFLSYQIRLTAGLRLIAGEPA